MPRHKARSALSASKSAGADCAAQDDCAAGRVSVGLVVGVPAEDGPLQEVAYWVTYPENTTREARLAMSLAHLPSISPGQSVLLQFIGNDRLRPVVMGVISGPQGVSRIDAQALHVASNCAEADEEDTISVHASKRLVLRCGRASIVLQEDGQIEIRGTDVINRASSQVVALMAGLALN